MRVCYYALRTVRVLDEDRLAGDLIPEAAAWPYLPGYVRDGYVAPVLVATLPQDVQAVLLEWEADQRAAVTGTTAAVAPEATSATPSGDGTTAATSSSKTKQKVSV